MIKLYTWKETSEEDKQRIMQRSQLDMAAIQGEVAEWIEKVKASGDAAILEYIRTFDDPNFEIQNLRVTVEDIAEAYANIDPIVLKTIKRQISISRAFHEKQKDNLKMAWQVENIPGVITGAKKVPIEAVGLYVPAGKARLPTVAQILTIAATVAGVPRKVVCFAPTAKNYEIIVAAKEAGADEIYRVGGIAAIAALAFGTETIKPVYKIVGPGNPYVQAAKLQVVRKVGIDMLSGPSEALIMADETSKPKFLAADILARCEHGSDSAGVVVTTSRKIAESTLEEIKRQAPLRTRQQYIQKALSQYSAIVVVDIEQEMIDFTNDYSAEHLEIQTKAPQKTFASIKNAGSVFLGNYAPVAVGDYASGTNHCLPTGVAPKFASPINVESFMKDVQFQQLTKEGLRELQDIVQIISRLEGLDAHEASVNIRFEN